MISIFFFNYKVQCTTPRLQMVQATFRNHITLHVRDGSSSFWDSCWLESGPLRPHLLLANPPQLSIKEIYNDGTWRRDVLRDYLDDDLRNLVTQRSLTFIPQPDCLIWKPSPSGVFFISSAYTVVHAQRPRHPLAVNFWKPNIPIKISILLWHLLNGFVSFSVVLVSLGFSLATKCLHCSSIDSI